MEKDNRNLQWLGNTNSQIFLYKTNQVFEWITLITRNVWSYYIFKNIECFYKEFKIV